MDLQDWTINRFGITCRIVPLIAPPNASNGAPARAAIFTGAPVNAACSFRPVDSGKRVQQGAQHPIGRSNDRRTGFCEQKGLARVEEGIGDVLVTGIRDLLRVLIEAPVAGRKRVEPAVDRTRWTNGRGYGAEGTHQGYIGTTRRDFKILWI